MPVRQSCIEVSKRVKSLHRIRHLALSERIDMLLDLINNLTLLDNPFIKVLLFDSIDYYRGWCIQDRGSLQLQIYLLLPPYAKTTQDSDPFIDNCSESLIISTSTLTLFPLAQHEKQSL